MICGQKFSRKERLKTHLSYVHSKGEKQHKPITLGSMRDTKMIPMYQYPNQQGLTLTSVQQHVPTQLAISIPRLVFPLSHGMGINNFQSNMVWQNKICGYSLAYGCDVFPKLEISSQFSE